MEMQIWRKINKIQPTTCFNHKIIRIQTKGKRRLYQHPIRDDQKHTNLFLTINRGSQ